MTSGASKAAPPTSYVAAVKGESTAPKSTDKDKAKEDKEAIKEKAESLQQMLDDLPEDSLLRPDLETQLQSLQGQLEDKRSKGARLDSAEARLRRAEASQAKKEQALEDAAKALEEAKQETEEAQKALEEVRAIMVPNTVDEPQEEEETVIKLGLADVHDLHKPLHNLQARIHNSSEAERPAKKSRDNTGAGTAQFQDDTQTNEILHRLGAVVQAHQPQQAVGPARAGASGPGFHRLVPRRVHFNEAATKLSPRPRLVEGRLDLLLHLLVQPAEPTHGHQPGCYTTCSSYKKSGKPSCHTLCGTSRGIAARVPGYLLGSYRFFDPKRPSHLRMRGCPPRTCAKQSPVGGGPCPRPSAQADRKPSIPACLFFCSGYVWSASLVGWEPGCPSFLAHKAVFPCLLPCERGGPSFYPLSSVVSISAWQGLPAE